MIISVASGKGGTGKTTVATNLARAINEQVTFLDCDVEEPNAHLFLAPDITESREIFSFLPKIEEGNCNQCGKCRDICRFGAITLVGRTVLLFPELCHSCGGCLEVCPQKCIAEDAKLIGTIESGTADKIDFHHGILHIGEAMSPPLIKRLRKNHQHGEIIILDAPPGTSCPVIAAMHETHFIILVTEPTPFGLHDLKLAHETVKQLEIPCGIVINRADLGDYSVHRYAASKNLPILLEIPFSKYIAELYSRGILLVEAEAEWASTFQKLFETIKNCALVERSKA